MTQPMIGLLLFAAVAVPAVAAPAFAQSEAVLKSSFEGRTVMVKLDMPAAEDGVDVYPGTEPPLDYSQYATRLKRYGTAIHNGERAMVTKVKVKGKLIEFQLGGGGYGTFGDQTDPTVSVPPVPKSQREKDLERDIKTETDPVIKRRMEQERDALKAAREKEDRRNQAAAANATERRRALIAAQRLQSGSRFNVRYKNGVPAEALTPKGLEQALAAYVDFEPALGVPASTEPAFGAEIRKGMLVDEVDEVLGAPIRRSDRMEGSLRVNTRTYERGGVRLTGDFVEGVLVRAIRSEIVGE